MKKYTASESPKSRQTHKSERLNRPKELHRFGELTRHLAKMRCTIEDMGTAKRWIEVALTGGFWAGCMLLFDMMRGDNFGQSTRAHILSTIVAGFWFGLLVTFGWQAVHSPLLYLVIPAFVSTVLAGLLYRQRRLRSQAKPSTTPN